MARFWEAHGTTYATYFDIYSVVALEKANDEGMVAVHLNTGAILHVGKGKYETAEKYMKALMDAITGRFE